MTAVTSTVFWTVQFPHLGIIVTIDQLDLCMPDVTTSMDNNIPMLGQSPPPYQSIGVCMLKDSSLMGIFPSTPPSTDTATVHMITSFDYEPKAKKFVESTRSYVWQHSNLFRWSHGWPSSTSFGSLPFTILVRTFSSCSTLSLWDFSFQWVNYGDHEYGWGHFGGSPS